MERFKFSNFYNCRIEYVGMVFPTPENLYQALKTTDVEKRKEFTTISAVAAKRKGRKLTIREDWEEIRVAVMRLVQQLRFENPEWRQQLLETGEEQLIEYNYWHDNFWGVCTCEKCGNNGHNMLGKIIMEIREEINSGMV